MMFSESWNPEKIEDILIKEGNAIIIYDGICNLCDFCMNFLRKRNQNNLLSFIPFQDMVTILKILKKS